MREILLDGRLEFEDQKLIRKLMFFFGDSIEEDEEDLYDREYKWLHQISNQRFFLPNMEHMFP